MTDAQSGPSAGQEQESEPRASRRVLITRPPARAQGIADALAAYGIESLAAATTLILPVVGEPRLALARALLSPSKYDWLLLTSANAVHACQTLLEESGSDMLSLSALKLATMGQASARALEDCGLSAAIAVQAETSEDLARLLLEEASQASPHVLFPRAKHGRDEAPAVLQAGGALVDLQVAYSSQVVAASDPDWQHALAELKRGTVQGVAFFAPSQVDALVELYPEALQKLASLPVIGAIGPTTAAALELHGLHANAIADQPTSQDLADKILQAFS